MKLHHLLVVLALAALTVLPVVAGVQDSSHVVIARDYPNAAVFMQMARRGILDHTARHGTFPPSLQALQDNGYTAYLLPTNWRPQYEVSPDEAVVNLLGHPVYFGGESIKTSNVAVRRPAAGLFHDAAQDYPDTSTGRVVNRPGTARVWHFPGANWLDQGRSWPEVDQALRLERVAIHLNWLTFEYNQARGSMPGDVHDLERYQGVERNPLGWRGITEVSSADAVGLQPGNLFVGWHRNAWVVSLNLGWGLIDTHRWVPGQRGLYTCNAPLIY